MKERTSLSGKSEFDNVVRSVAEIDRSVAHISRLSLLN